MVRISVFSVIFFSFISQVAAQIAPGKYWIEFTDKNNTPYNLNEPEVFLSERAIMRRCNQNIAIDWYDIPVNQSYIDAVVALPDVSFLYASKWFNAIALNIHNTEQLEVIMQFPFVSGYRSVQGFSRPELDERVISPPPSSRNQSYGTSYHQVAMLNGHYLHDEGYNGAGIQIGVMDGGFAAVNTMMAFENMFNEDRLLGTYDFVGLQNDVYHSSTHGTYVLSTMASYWPDSLIGSAYGASYYLFLTEDVTSEYRIEEQNWIAAAEFADSAGVDVLNTSLGYTLFDDSLQNYTYADMDGQTAWISRAGNRAASRGMLVISSAGNSGGNAWRYISAPADADSVLAIGAVRADSVVTGFSSRGPSFDGRVKPNVCAQGLWTVLAETDNTVRVGNGTSFSSPVLAGLAACLWQTNPMATSGQVFHAIEQSAHLYNSPNDSLGFGLPDFQLARTILNDMVLSTKPAVFENSVINVYPNPFTDFLSLIFSIEHSQQVDCRIYDVSGRLVHTKTYPVMKGETRLEIASAFTGMPTGQYLVHLNFDGRSEMVKVQKVN
jgi:serine protease AprX